MEQSALKAVINMVEVSQLVEMLEHRVVEKCVALFNSNGAYRKTQKSKLIQKLCQISSWAKMMDDTLWT